MEYHETIHIICALWDRHTHVVEDMYKGGHPMKKTLLAIFIKVREKYLVRLKVPPIRSDTFVRSLK